MTHLVTDRRRVGAPWLFGALLTLALGCEKTPGGSPSASSSSSPSSLASSAPTGAGSSGADVAKSAPHEATMPLAEFCKALHQKLDAMVATCHPKPATEDLFKILQMSADELGEDDNPCGRLKNVVVLADKVPACLAEVRSHWEGGLVHIAHTDACRAALVGSTPAGASCGSDVECVAGSFCVADPASKEPLASICAPSTNVGATCIEHRGEACAPALDCKAGRCEKRPVAGEACSSRSQSCAPGLTCLIDAAKAPEGHCAPRRKTGEACHRWTECEGACVTPKGSDDGKCEAFCGSG